MTLHLYCEIHNILKLFLKFLFSVYECFAYMHVLHHVYTVSVDARVGFGSPRTGVTGGCELGIKPKSSVKVVKRHLEAGL